MKTDEITVGDMIVDRATLRGLIAKRIAEAKPAQPGEWVTLFRWHRAARLGNILSAALYRSPDYSCLFVWVFGWGWSIRLSPAVRYAGRGW